MSVACGWLRENTVNVFWPESNSDRHISATIASVEGFMLSAQIFVHGDQVAAQRKAAASHVDQMIAVRSDGRA